MTNILISGAGIAGPALAYWLRRAGHDVTVVERAPGVRPGGQAVDLRGAGRLVVERMGLLERVRAVELDQRGIAWVDGRGRVTARMPVDAFAGEGIISEIEVLRDDLAGVLHDATAAGVDYRFGDTVTALRQDDDGVDVTFEHAPPQRFGLVVGADGLYSPVRALAFGNAGLHPLGCAMAWFSAPAVDDAPGWYLMHNAPGGRVASIRPGREPHTAKAGLALRVDPAAPLPRAAADQKELFARAFSDVGWRAPELVAALRTAPDFAFTAVAQVRLPRWSRGRVVLVGDAAACPTPITGLGTSVALVQAYVLAGELAATGRTGGDHRVAFDRYEQVARAYVDEAQQLPPGGIDGFAPTSGVAIRLRSLSMRAMTRWPLRPLLERQFAKAGAIDLPRYAVDEQARAGVAE